MKKSLLLIFCLTAAITLQCRAQAPDSIVWQSVFGGIGYDHLFHTLKCADGGFMLTGQDSSNDGTFLGTSLGAEDACIIKTDSVGQLQWLRTFGGSAYDKARYCIEDFNGDFVVLGSTHSVDSDIVINRGNSDAIIAKYDAQGNKKWIKTLGGTKEEGGRCVKQLRDSNYIFAVWSNSNNFDVPGGYGNYDSWIFKTDTALNIIWSKHYGGTKYDRCRIIYELDDDGFIFFGNSYSNDSITNDSLLSGNHGDSDFLLTRLDANGNQLWSKQYGGCCDDKGYGLTPTMDGGFLFCGYSESNDGDVIGAHGNREGWVVKVDSMGTLLWSRAMGGTKDDNIYRAYETLDGGWVALGNAQSQDGDLSLTVHPNSGYDFWFIKFDSLNNVVFNECYGGSELEQGNDILFEPNNSFVLGGVTHSNDLDVSMGFGYEDFWIFKVMPSVNVGIFDPSSVPFAFQFYDDNLIVKSPDSGNLKIEIFTTTGALAYSQDLGMHDGGTRSHHLNTKNFLADEMYLFKMWINDKFQVRKIVYKTK
ncbi:MAG TPA: hypothetical protein VJY62_00145 [Bacteroidia bacterium]|nr:hypothetical protein [Bacteroidia bacterium]